MTRTREYRFFCPELRPGQLCLDPREAHHAANVLRLTAGQEVLLFDGKGNSAGGKIVEIKKNKLLVQADQGIDHQPEPAETIELAFAVPKGKRLDWLLEKATELAAGVLQPVIFDRSVAGSDELSPAKLDKWLGHCISAAKQCGLNYLPEVRQPVSFADLLGQAFEGTILLGEAKHAAGIGQALQDHRPGQAIQVIIGPEGGLSDSERQAASAAGCRPVRLGRTTLRIETAAAAMLAGIIAVNEAFPAAGIDTGAHQA